MKIKKSISNLTFAPNGKKKVFCKILEDFSSIIKIIYDFILKYVTCNVMYSFISIHII